MKKTLSALFLLSGLLLYGCSSGGGTTASSDGGNSTLNPGGGSQYGPVSTFTLNLVDYDAKAARFTNPGATPTATDVRVVIRRTEDKPGPLDCPTDDSGNPIPDAICTPTIIKTEVYKDIQDVAYPTNGNSISIGIPAGTGYTLDVITSKLEGTTHSILKHGQATNVDVPGDGSAEATMKTVSEILNMTVDNSVVSKGKFDVTLNSVRSPFANNYKMTMSFAGATPVVTNTAADKCTFTAPESFLVDQRVSLQGAFTVDKSFLKPTETPAWGTRLFPNADSAYGGEAVYSNLDPLILITVPL